MVECLESGIEENRVPEAESNELRRIIESKTEKLNLNFVVLQIGKRESLDFTETPAEYTQSVLVDI